MYKIFITLVMAFCLGTVGSSWAAPVDSTLLGSVTHDYGWGVGKVNPGGSDPLLYDTALVTDISPWQFTDDFLFSGIVPPSMNISGLELTLTYALNQADNYEQWYVQPGGGSEYFAMDEAGLGFVTQSFWFDSTLDFFDTATKDGIFNLQFSELTGCYDWFLLDSAKLSVFGGDSVLNDNPAPVPEPATMLLSALGLASFAALRRRKS